MEDQSINGAPAGVTFDNEPNSATTTNPAPAAAPAPQGAPQGVTFGAAKPAVASPAGAPQGVTFGEAKALPQTEDTTDPYRALSQATTIGPREHSFHNWLQDLQSDVHNGTDSTWFGAMLKKLGAKGTAQGVSPGTANFIETVNPIASVPMGLSKLGEGGIEVLRNAKPVMKNMLAGDSFEAAVAKAVAEDPQLLKKAEIGTNKVIGGAFQTVGPVAALAAPEATLAAAPVIGSAMAAQDLAQRTAKHFGADDDDAELIGNISGLMVATKVHSKMETARFETAVNTKLNAESVYKTRAQELDIARQQATVAQTRALEAAKDEWNQVQSNPQMTDQQKQELRQRTDVARTTASEAAKNADNAQKAFEQANDSRAQAGLELKKFSRGLQEKAAKAAVDQANETKKTHQINRETMQKAIPAKGTDIYEADENGAYPKYDIVRSHLEAAKDRGMPVDTIADARNAVEDSRQRIEDTITEKSEPIKDEPLVLDPTKEESPAITATKKLEQLARVDDNFKDASDYIRQFNTTDLTVGETRDLITKLNDYQRAIKKSSNNWDIYNQIQTNPKFAALWFLADAARDSWYDRLEKAEVPGVAEARKETAALVDFRNAADAQLRRNAGGTTVRGSGSNVGPVRSLIAKLTGKTIKGAGIAAGAEVGGAPGAVLGGAIGEMLGEPVQDYIAPGDMTRDEHVAKSMKTRGTLRKPAEITGEARTTEIPETPVPPAPKPVEGPQNIELTPRENTKLHSDLATHFQLTDLNERSYQDLEKDLKSSLQDKKDAGVAWTPEESKLMARVNEADALDRGKIDAANKAAKATGAKSEEQLKAEELLKNKAIKEAEPAAPVTKETLDLNPHLQSLGRGDESALVSHPIADNSKAHSAPMEIPGRPEGLSNDSAHQHEWAHLAMGAIDGLEPFDYISHLHPDSPASSAARARFTVEALKDENGNVDPEKLMMQETQYLTKKMAGPASHEVFDNLAYDDIKKMSNTAGDFRSARRMVRELHPEFSPSQVEAAIDAAYQRARNFLSNPDVAKRIRANASVREDNLSPEYHASAGRVHQFAEDIRKVINDGEDNGNDAGPDGGQSGEGGKKAENAGEEGQRGNGAAKEAQNAGRDSGGREGGARSTSKQSANARGGTGLSEEEQTRKPSIPPERTTGDEARDAAIKKGGAVPGGVMKGDASIGLPELTMFHDPETGTTLALKTQEGVTPEKVAEKLKASRAEYAKYAKPEGEDQTVQEQEEKSNYHPDLQKIADTYGTTTDPESVRKGASFIAPDGKFINLGSTEHPVAIEAATNRGGDAEAVGARVSRSENTEIYNPETKKMEPVDNRVGFMRDTGAVRTRFRQSIAGKELVASVPAKGVTEDQISALRQAVGQGLGRNGNLLIEVGEPGGKSASKEFASPRDVEPMLREIGVHPEQKTANGGFEEVPTGKVSREELDKAYEAYSQKKIGKATLSGLANGDPEDMAIWKAVNEHPNGGFTVDPRTGATPNDGYMVETKKIEKTFDKQPRDVDYRKFLDEHREELNNDPALHLGGWVNPEGKYTVALLSRVPDRQTAINLGKQHNQVSIFDLGKGEEIPTGGTGDYVANEDQTRGSSVPLMENPLKVKGTGEGNKISTLDVAKALNAYSRKQHPALEMGEAEPEAQVKRAKKIAEDEAKYQLAQGKTGTEWYTTEMKDHDDALKSVRPEFEGGEPIDAPTAWPHNPQLSLFKAIEAITSSGQKPYGNFKAAVKAWDLYKENGEFPRTQADGKSWGPRGVAAYGNAMDMLNKLVDEKGEKGAAEWLLSEHPVSELKDYNKDVKGKKTDEVPGAMILGAKRGPFMQNLHGIESAFTADMWVTRTWNRWMGTMEPGINSISGEPEIQPSAPRNKSERDLMHKSFSETADKLGLSTSSLQAVLWYYEQALYSKQGIPKESWSFRDAAQRAVSEMAKPEEQESFKFGANEGKQEAGFNNLGPAPKKGQVSAGQFLNALKGEDQTKAIPPQNSWDAFGPKTAPGLSQRGNINLNGRPVVQNDDGTHSSEYSTSFEQNGKEVLVPTVVDGKFLTPDGKKPKAGSPEEKAMFRAAWQHYLQTGQHLGKFDTPEHADAYAEAIHNRALKGTK